MESPVDRRPTPLPRDQVKPTKEALLQTLAVVADERLLDCFAKVPRERFVAPGYEADAYANAPLPIGRGQTISQPQVVAHMIALLQLKPGDRVLEIGTGTGYQAAILAQYGAEVFSIENDAVLHERAQAILAELGFGATVHLKCADGHHGWPEEAPFDGIILAAAPTTIPEPLEDQLRVGGRLVAPVRSDGEQHLYIVHRTSDGLERARHIPVRFVPMTKGVSEPD